MDIVSRKIQIGVIGYAGAVEYPKDKAPKQSIYEDAERVGFLLAEKGVIVVTGGKSGVMESAARGARKANGITVGVIKGNQRFRSNDFTDVEVVTGMTADGFDEFMLVTMCDALITIGGGAGTLEEVVIAYRNKKPVIALEKTGGWADKTSETYLDERETIKIEPATTPEEAVEKAIKYSQQSYD
ncbi:MAG: TIGR00725 family protein [Candidatus Kerfeldbacteria bacterium]|nr:TIGR00725 family protein [Candidatus Kerfeldbacteria bacterium]